MRERPADIPRVRARRHDVFVFSFLLVCVVSVGGLAACRTQTADDDEAASVVTKSLEARKNNDYEAWISTQIEERQKASTKESWPGTTSW